MTEDVDKDFLNVVTNWNAQEENESVERKEEIEDHLEIQEPLDLSTSHLVDIANPNHDSCQRNWEIDMSHPPHPFSITNVLRPNRPIESSNRSPLANPTSFLTEVQTPPLGTRDTEKLSNSTSITATSILGPILRTRGKERSLLPCSVCGKAFDRPSLLKRHMRTHTGEKPHVCDVCGKGFSTSSSLNTHRRIHSGEKPHQCPICGKRFTASSNLYYHRMTHNKEKPHKCLLCGKSFPTPGDLKSHQYVHSGTWPFTCPTCHRGFSKQTNLRNHLLLHSGDKPHHCVKCGKKFALSCNLRAHLKTHEEDNFLQSSASVTKCVKCRQPNLFMPGAPMSQSSGGTCHVCSRSTQVTSSNALTVDTARENSKGHSEFSSVKVRTFLPPTFDEERQERESISEFVSRQSHPSISLGRNQLLPLHADRERSHELQQGVGGFLTHPNPFLENLIAWNLQFAQETRSFEFIQQKLLESHFLTAHLFRTIPIPNPATAFSSFHPSSLLLIPGDKDGDWSRDTTNKTQ